VINIVNGSVIYMDKIIRGGLGSGVEPENFGKALEKDIG
jgi:hypothetical protein